MIAEAIDRILGLGQAEIVTVNGRHYSDRRLLPMQEPLPDPIKMHTLSGLLDYVQGDLGSIEVPRSASTVNPIAVHVESHQKVSIISAVIGPFKQREVYAVADITGMFKAFPFGQWLSIENFIIELQTKFVSEDATQRLLSFVGNIKEEIVRQSSDDGFSQTVMAKAGIARVAEVTVPNPVVLRPYRTFLEIKQPASTFVFRMKSAIKDGDGPTCSLHEADGGTWQLDAVASIAAWFRDNLPDVSVIA